MGVTHDQSLGVEEADVVKAEIDRQRLAKPVLADEPRGQKLDWKSVPFSLPVRRAGGLVKRHKERSAAQANWRDLCRGRL